MLTNQEQQKKDFSKKNIVEKDRQHLSADMLDSAIVVEDFFISVEPKRNKKEPDPLCKDLEIS